MSENITFKEFQSYMDNFRGDVFGEINKVRAEVGEVKIEVAKIQTTIAKNGKNNPGNPGNGKKDLFGILKYVIYSLIVAVLILAGVSLGANLLMP